MVRMATAPSRRRSIMGASESPRRRRRKPAAFLDTGSACPVFLRPRGPEPVLLRVPRGPVSDLPLAAGPRAHLSQRDAQLLGALPAPRRALGVARLGDLQLRVRDDPRARRSRVLRGAAHHDLPRSAAARSTAEA